MSARRIGKRLFTTEGPTAPLAVTNTLHRFFHVLDGIGDSSMGELFTDGGTMHVMKASLMLTGSAEVDAWCARMREMWDGKATLHTESNIVLSNPEPGVFVNHSVWTAIIDGTVTSYGTHADVLEATTAEAGLEFKFRRRVIRHLYAA